MKNNRPEGRLPVRPTVRQPVAQKTIKSRFLQIAGRALPGLTIALVLLTVITFLVVDPGQGFSFFLYTPRRSGRHHRPVCFHLHADRLSAGNQS